MASEEEGRVVALKRYKILAGLMGLLTAGLLIMGIIAVTMYPENGFGPPYYLGCFIVGCLGLIHTMVSTRIVSKGGDIDNDDIKKREIQSTIKGHYALSIFLCIGCFFGIFFAVVSLSGFVSGPDEPTGYEDKVEALSGITIACCILTLGVNIFGIRIVITYGRYFGVHINDHRTGAAETTFDTQTGVLHNDGTGTNAIIQSLTEENRLLQENLRLQQELNQQRRSQRTHNVLNPSRSTIYPMGGVYHLSAHSFPTDPPPSYYSVN
ncbi:uncharacterized protein LOC128235398 isoform X1 [Mya arenaria]|uniref:uncharacterized protein LOC128235398 isoform X1 n=1 Tax=Mya arenaria TaxID=6604 RepID=UPI0022E85E84|nr:uncharacterized protein LOC128235398 isoform X1 [Mya arenaria]